MTDNKIDELIKRFDETNGNRQFTTRDLLKYIIGKIDDLDDKIDDTNGKLDNHITTISSRITAIETSISNFKWFFGSGLGFAIIVAIISLYMQWS